LKSSGDGLLTIGDLARRTGRRASSIRYYESIGLLPRPPRVSGRRRYSPETIRTLAVLETAQRAGLSLAEIGTLLEARPDDASAIERLRELAERRLPEVRALIERTQLVERWLESASECTCPSLDDCPLFDEPSLPQRSASSSDSR
jgi:DNA-binding transcriptional MerR regulator